MAKIGIRKPSSWVFGAALAACVAAVPAHAQTRPLAAERIETVNGRQVKLTSKLLKVKKVLVPQFYYGYNHDEGRAEIQRLLALIGAEDGITFEHFDKGNEAQFSVDKMKTSNAAVILGSNMTSVAEESPAFTTAQKAGVQNFVEVQGGGFVIIHGTGDSKGKTAWPWLIEKAHPAGYLGHGAIGQTTRVWQPTSNTNLAPLSDNAAGHPVYEGIPRGYTVLREEFHNFTNIINDVVPSAKILLHVDDNYSGFDCRCTKRPTRGHPISWTFPLAKGTIVYHAFGHNDELATNTWGTGTRDQNNWKRFLRQAIYYAAGYDTTEVTTRLRGDAADYRFGEGGMAFHGKAMGVLFTGEAPHRVQVLDVKGRVVADRKGSGSREYSFEGGRFPRGIYYLRAASGKSLQTRKYLVGGA